MGNNYLDIFLWAAFFSVEELLHHLHPVQTHAANAFQNASPMAWSNELPAHNVLYQSEYITVRLAFVAVKGWSSHKAHVSVPYLVVCKKFGS